MCIFYFKMSQGLCYVKWGWNLLIFFIGKYLVRELK